MVELRAITKDNLNEVLRLNISEQQKTFVSSTALSLTQAYVYIVKRHFLLPYMPIIL